MPQGIPPGRLAQIQADFLRESQALFDQARLGTLPAPEDRRFSSPAWLGNPQALFTAHAYLISVRALRRMAEAVEWDDASRQRLQFAVMQWTEALSPANFLATNPDAMVTAWRTHGQSLLKGM